MKRAGSRLFYYFSYHFKQSKISYILICISLICGFALGITLHFTSSIGSFFLNDNDQQIFDFVTKDVTIIKFMLSKIGSYFVSLLLLFVCCLSFYSCFVCFAFFVYQGMIFAASCCQIISLYNLLGIVNVFVVLVPVNLVLFMFMAYFVSVSIERAGLAKHYKMTFKSSFLYKQYYWKEIGACFVVGVLFLIVVSIVFYVSLRSFSFVIF